MQPNNTSNGKSNWRDDDPDDTLDAIPPEILSRAATGWIRRGYQVRYSDDYLVQLIRRGWPGRKSLPFIVLALLGFAGAVAALIIAQSRRPWHVVTLALGPGERVLTHQQWSTHPPEQ